VRQHLQSSPPHAHSLGSSLRQAQELDADGYGIFHHLKYFLNGDGRMLTSQMLKISSSKHLENSVLSAFLLAGMVQFCARWAGKVQVEADFGAEHPPHPLRIKHMLLITEMWCREVGCLSTEWNTDGTAADYFSAAARLFPAELKTTWDDQISWLRSTRSYQYRTKIGSSVELLRTGKVKRSNRPTALC
jgi:hypothetical protein